MQRGLYIAGTGMMIQRRLMENVTNNITNVETTGYKKNYLITHSFDEVMLERYNDVNVAGVSSYAGPLTFGTLVDQVYQNFSQGGFETTGRSTDLALAGDGFFVLDTPEGERYSRSGALAITVDGYITDPDGNYLLGQNGRIHVGTDKFLITTDGAVSVDGEYIDTVRIAYFEDNNTLRKQGDNLYFTAAEPQYNTGTTTIQQGMLENSNADVSREMVDMLTVYRAYETNQKILSMIDETLGKAVNEIGGLR